MCIDSINSHGANLPEKDNKFCGRTTQKVFQCLAHSPKLSVRGNVADMLFFTPWYYMGGVLSAKQNKQLISNM